LQLLASACSRYGGERYGEVKDGESLELFDSLVHHVTHV
jgi:hypothetical protein